MLVTKQFMFTAYVFDGITGESRKLMEARIPHRRNTMREICKLMELLRKRHDGLVAFSFIPEVVNREEEFSRGESGEGFKEATNVGPALIEQSQLQSDVQQAMSGELSTLRAVEGVK
jgi:hypothetical protein